MAQSSLCERYLALLAELTPLTDRDDKNQLLVKRLGRLQQMSADSDKLEQFEQKLLAFYESEWDHQYLVNTALRRINNKRRHDWSKDYVYIFLLAGKFCYRVESSTYLTLFQQEVDRHYKMEAHHPQHTQYGGVITKLDVQETALDQLARNAYRNKGSMDEESMQRFLPKFEDAKHLQWFKEYVHEHKALMHDVYTSYVRSEEARNSSTTSTVTS